MKIGQLKKVLNKWQFLFEIDWAWEQVRKKMIRLAILKMKQLPSDFECLNKKHFSGIYFTKNYTSFLTIIKRYLDRKGY